MLGDFKIHVDGSEKNDAAQFIDLRQSADLQQHVHCPTHTSGHTLDLVISDSDNTVVTDVRPDSFISDHESVLFELTHPKPQIQYTVVQSRKINNIDKAKFPKDILSSPLYKSPSSDLTTLTDQYNTVVAATLDDHAPFTKKRVAIKSNYPWLNEDFRSEKRKRKKFEQKWRKICFSSQKYLKSDKNSDSCTDITFTGISDIILLIVLWTLLDQQLKRRCLRLLAKILRNHVLQIQYQLNFCTINHKNYKHFTGNRNGTSFNEKGDCQPTPKKTNA